MIGCYIKQLPDEMLVAAADLAKSHNPANAPPPSAVEALIAYSQIALSNLGVGMPEESIPIADPQHLAVLTSKYWGSGGVRLTVGFMENVSTALKEKILQYANLWNRYANIEFVLSNTDPQIRITLDGDGYWSNLGTDIPLVPKNQPTMCLEKFSLSTPDSEYMRVVPHEFGHSCGFPHEHMRQELVNLLDPTRTIMWFARYQGWSAQMTRQQVLTPLATNSIMSTAQADQDSIMCYQLPGDITKNGQPIRGGSKIDDLDGAFASKMYPKAVQPKPPVKKRKRLVLSLDDDFAAVDSYTDLES